MAQDNDRPIVMAGILDIGKAARAGRIGLKVIEKGKVTDPSKLPPPPKTGAEKFTAAGVEQRLKSGELIVGDATQEAFKGLDDLLPNDVAQALERVMSENQIAVEAIEFDPGSKLRGLQFVLTTEAGDRLLLAQITNMKEVTGKFGVDVYQYKKGDKGFDLTDVVNSGESDNMAELLNFVIEHFIQDGTVNDPRASKVAPRKLPPKTEEFNRRSLNLTPGEDSIRTIDDTLKWIDGILEGAEDTGIPNLDAFLDSSIKLGELREQITEGTLDSATFAEEMVKINVRLDEAATDVRAVLTQPFMETFDLIVDRLVEVAEVANKDKEVAILVREIKNEVTKFLRGEISMNELVATQNEMKEIIESMRVEIRAEAREKGELGDGSSAFKLPIERQQTNDNAKQNVPKLDTKPLKKHRFFHGTRMTFDKLELNDRGEIFLTSNPEAAERISTFAKSNRRPEGSVEGESRVIEVEIRADIKLYTVEFWDGRSQSLDTIRAEAEAVGADAINILASDDAIFRAGDADTSQLIILNPKVIKQGDEHLFRDGAGPRTSLFKEGDEVPAGTGKTPTDPVEGERIVRSVVIVKLRSNGAEHIFFGNSHGEAFALAEDAFGTSRENNPFSQGWRYFETSAGRIIGQKEAGKITTANGQAVAGTKGDISEDIKGVNADPEDGSFRVNKIKPIEGSGGDDDLKGAAVLPLAAPFADERTEAEARYPFLKQFRDVQIAPAQVENKGGFGEFVGPDDPTNPLPGQFTITVGKNSAGLQGGVADTIIADMVHAAGQMSPEFNVMRDALVKSLSKSEVALARARYERDFKGQFSGSTFATFENFLRVFWVEGMVQHLLLPERSEIDQIRKANPQAAGWLTSIKALFESNEPTFSVTTKKNVFLRGLTDDVLSAVQQTQQIVEAAGVPFVVTDTLGDAKGRLSKTRGSKTDSKHFTGQAFDIRISRMTRKKQNAIVKQLKAKLGHHFDVVLKSNHIHIEKD